MPDNAIWAVTGPEHDARMARELAWIATGGQTGIVGPESLEVVAQNTPNNTVRIMPGGFSIAATSQSANIGYTSAPWQSYMRAVYQPITVEIDATGSSGGRTDVVGIVVDDPEFEGTSPDPDAHQYWRPHVVRNAGNNATRPEHFASLGRPFLPLAQVRIPSSTATITNSMITDIRFLAVSRSHTVPFAVDANPDGDHIEIGPSQSTWLSFGETTGVQVPQWATQATVSATVTQVIPLSGSSMGRFRFRIEGANTPFSTVQTTFLENANQWNRFDLHAAGVIPLHPSTQGTTISIMAQIIRDNASTHGGTIRIPSYTSSIARVFGNVVFEEGPRSTEWQGA